MPTIEKIEPSDVGERTWGREVLLAHTPFYTLKALYMLAGKAGGLQFHRHKVESFHLFSGSAWVYFDAGDGVLQRTVMQAGETYTIPVGAVHKVEAITDCIFFEASNPVFDDRVRVEHLYNLPQDGGLPTT